MASGLQSVCVDGVYLHRIGCFMESGSAHSRIQFEFGMGLTGCLFCNVSFSAID